VQLGGGIRDLDTIERYLDDGLSYVIIGTAASRTPASCAMPARLGGHIIVGLDAKDGKVATDGWSKLTGHEVVDLAKKFEDYGVEAVIYTDIGRDGMLTGINIDATVKLAQALSIPVIASGGLSNMADIEALCAVEGEGVEGVICGRSIYTGALDFSAAQLRADELGAQCPAPGRRPGRLGRQWAGSFCTAARASRPRSAPPHRPGWPWWASRACSAGRSPAGRTRSCRPPRGPRSARRRASRSAAPRSARHVRQSRPARPRTGVPAGCW
jgi:uncharacterized protein related to proFAR isomerase